MKTGEYKQLSSDTDSAMINNMVVYNGVCYYTDIAQNDETNEWTETFCSQDANTVLTPIARSFIYAAPSLRSHKSTHFYVFGKIPLDNSMIVCDNIKVLMQNRFVRTASIIHGAVSKRS